MKKLNIQVNDLTTKESTGTLEWVRDLLNNRRVGIFSDTHDAKLCAILYSDHHDDGIRWETIIAKEASEYTDASKFRKKEFHGPYTIAKCYSTTTDKGKETLFTTELTPAAMRLAERYIEECIYVLVAAIEKRDAAEEEIFDNMLVNVHKDNNDIITCVQAIHMNDPEEKWYTWEVPEYMFISDGEYLLVEQHNGNVTVVKAAAKTFRQSKSEYLKNTHPYLCKVLKNLGSNVEDSFLKLF